MTIIAAEKRCARCKLVKAAAFFHRNSNLPDGLHQYCKECRTPLSKDYHQRNKDKIAAYHKQWYEQNKDYERERKREWAHKNIEHVRKKQRQNAPRYRARSTAWLREWRRRNPEKVWLQKRRRYARETGAPGDYTLAEWQALCDRYDRRCLRCGKQEPEITLTVDHVIPVSKGGSNSIDNLQPLCGSCNSVKHDHDTDYRY